MIIKDSLHSTLDLALLRANRYQVLLGYKAQVRESDNGYGFLVEVSPIAFKLMTGHTESNLK